MKEVSRVWIFFILLVPHSTVYLYILSNAAQAVRVCVRNHTLRHRHDVDSVSVVDAYKRRREKMGQFDMDGKTDSYRGRGWAGSRSEATKHDQAYPLGYQPNSLRCLHCVGLCSLHMFVFCGVLVSRSRRIHEAGQN
jgi:hypothetical protein